MVWQQHIRFACTRPLGANLRVSILSSTCCLLVQLQCGLQLGKAVAPTACRGPPPLPPPQRSKLFRPTACLLAARKAAHAVPPTLLLRGAGAPTLLSRGAGAPTCFLGSGVVFSLFPSLVLGAWVGVLGVLPASRARLGSARFLEGELGDRDAACCAGTKRNRRRGAGGWPKGRGKGGKEGRGRARKGGARVVFATAAGESCEALLFTHGPL